MTPVDIRCAPCGRSIGSAVLHADEVELTVRSREWRYVRAEGETDKELMERVGTGAERDQRFRRIDSVPVGTPADLTGLGFRIEPAEHPSGQPAPVDHSEMIQISCPKCGTNIALVAKHLARSIEKGKPVRARPTSSG